MLKLNASITSLEEEGAFAVSDRAAALKAKGHPVINLGIGQPDFSPPNHILQAASKATLQGPHGYTSPTGIEPLRKAVARRTENRFGVGIDPDQVVIVPGGKVTIFFACMLFGGPGAEILYPDPGFPPYREAIKAAGAKPVPYEISEQGNFGFDAEKVLAAINSNTSLIIINSPANPTGGIVPRDQMKHLANGLAAHPHVAILSDEIYGELVYDTSKFVSFLEFDHLKDRVIILDGWSKTFAMTGWRLGYGIWPKALVGHVRKLITTDHSCVNAIAQVAGLAATSGPMDEVRGFVETFRKRRDFLVDGLNKLPGIKCQIPQGAFYAFPNITGTGQKSIDLAERLMEEVFVAVITGDAFGENGKGYLRISYAASLQEISQALERFKTIL